MNDSTFNPDTFLDQSTTEQGTRRPPVSSGLDFLGVIGEPKARNVPGKKDPNTSYVFCDIPITLDLTTHPTEVQRVGQEKVQLRHSFITDWADGKLDWMPGKNRVLTAYRDALGLNEKGRSFSPRDLVGRIVRAKVGHRTNEGEVYDEIASVTRP